VTVPRAVVTHRFEAAPARVFAAWLSPELIGRWMFGPALRDEEIVRIALDPRVGGTFSFVVRREVQGTRQEIDHIGRYLEIDRPRRLVFTWGVAGTGSDSRVIVEIAPAGDGAALTLTHELDPAWADYVDRTQAGWSTMLAALETVL
jgi:uncharacterized protein YndB with AHSA1/START domain